ncbi:hypothetical protein [Methylomonas albis]|uniref:PEP-CTERM sorting domain-containing protein n=1 Tax=Methylomonas albis TaxID=1854563 RepID=A0ABR9CWY8_9GAMM|nr:hypothetical protein [Methylomonas albis]MBD9354443.1 hypothetical protein [Methylomonas albis]CAD6877319.1 hypothetical protein [Methylomonas albis]
MKILSALFATFLYSASAHAALEFTFSGDFVNFTTGSFSGQLTFDALSPDSSDFFPATASDPASLRLSYSLSAPLSIVANSQALTIDNNNVVLNIVDNATGTTDDLIASHGFTGHVTAGVYDLLTLSMESSNNIYDENGLVSGTEFSVTGFFDQTLLSGTNLNPPNLQSLFGLPDPKYFVFEVNRKLGDADDYHGAGIITASDIVDTQVFTPVPLPGAAWLFGSVIAGLGLRFRKQA